MFEQISGIFFILPCIDAYARVDLRTRTYDVPPQEVSISRDFQVFNHSLIAKNCDSTCSLNFSFTFHERLKAKMNSWTREIYRLYQVIILKSVIKTFRLILFRFWRKTVSPSASMLSCIIVFQTPLFQLPTWKMRITRRDCWLKRPYVTRWVHGSCTRFSAKEWQFRVQCRWDYVNCYCED